MDPLLTNVTLEMVPSTSAGTAVSIVESPTMITVSDAVSETVGGMFAPASTVIVTAFDVVDAPTLSYRRPP